MVSQVMPTYTICLPKGSKLNNSAFKVICANFTFGLLTLTGIFFILGFMATSSGENINNIISHGTGLLFIVLPDILNEMGYVTYIVGLAFF